MFQWHMLVYHFKSLNDKTSVRFDSNLKMENNKLKLKRKALMSFIQQCVLLPS